MWDATAPPCCGTGGGERGRCAAQRTQQLSEQLISRRGNSERRGPKLWYPQPDPQQHTPLFCLVCRPAGCRACTAPAAHPHAEPAPSSRPRPRGLRAMRDRRSRLLPQRSSCPQRSAPQHTAESSTPSPTARLRAIMAQIDLAVCDCEDVDEIDPTRAWPPRGSELAAVRETDLHVGNSKASRPGCTVVPGTRRTSGPSLASSDMKISLLLRRHASQLREHGTTAHTHVTTSVSV